MNVILSKLGSCFVGAGCGYIYILYSKSQHALYVGQTNDQNGVVGRLCAHVSIKGTFRTRLLEQGISLDEVNDLCVFTYCLPRDPRFTGVDRTHREGVEYLVQKQLHAVRGQLKPYMRVASYVSYNDAARLGLIKSTAQEIFNSFLIVFSEV